MSIDLNSPTLQLLTLTLLAHIITDFILQPTSWVKHKNAYKIKSHFLYLHGILTGVVVFIFIGHLKLWWLALFIGITHTLIDLWKLYQKPTFTYFMIDQCAHICVLILGTTFAAYYMGWSPLPYQALWTTKSYLLILAYATVIWPAGYTVSLATLRWRKDVPSDNENKSLDDAGKWIGILERILVLTFVLGNHFSAIGFLIAAKSILRFTEKEAVKRTEYVLIGTLMSFGIAILVGLIVTRLIK